MVRATIEKYGNQMVLNIDGDKLIAYPTNNGVWIISGAGEPGPDPEPGDGSFAWPFPVTCISSEYGPRDGRIHQGTDFASVGTGEASPGADIAASNGGTIYNNPSVYHSGYGWHVIINHGVIGSVQIYTLYGHMVAPSSYSQGQPVEKSAFIGKVGNTGNSFGEHLHWETHVASPGNGPTWTNPGTHMNPRTFMASYG